MEIALAEIPVSEVDDWEKKRKAEAEDEFKKEQKRHAKNAYERERMRNMKQFQRAKYDVHLDKQMERARQRAKLLAEQLQANDPECIVRKSNFEEMKDNNDNNTTSFDSKANEHESFVQISDSVVLKDGDETNEAEEFTDDDDEDFIPVVDIGEIAVSRSYRSQTFENLRLYEQQLANARKVVEDSIMHPDTFHNMRATDILKYKFLARLFEKKYYYGTLLSYEKEDISFSVIYTDGDRQSLERKEVVLCIIRADKIPQDIQTWGNKLLKKLNC
jgi:hypothetical protein